MTKPNELAKLTTLVESAFEAGRELPTELNEALREAAQTKYNARPTLIERINGLYGRPVVETREEQLTAGYAFHKRAWNKEGIIPRPQWYVAAVHVHHYDGSGKMRACEHQLRGSDGVGMGAIMEVREPQIEVPPDAPMH